MNQFLQRMIRKTDEEKSANMRYFERSKTKKSFRRNISRATYESPNRTPALSRKSSFSRPAWMKKLGGSSDQPAKPLKLEPPANPMVISTSKTAFTPTSENTPSRLLSCRKAKTLPASLNETPNLERIVQEFESGFMSPRTSSEPGTGNFVKKIVAAFEEKYKSYNDSWSDRVRGKLKGSGLHRHSYSNICQSLNFTSVEIPQSSTETLSTEASSSDGSRSENYPKIESQDLDLTEDNEDLSTCNNRTPFIIGAFLKKPIKVDDISINWIPFPGKKLPRKKSLKKLLSTLSGRKCIEKKKEITFASQFNVNEDARELPDSGYDERSVSSSSLTSWASSTPDFPHQEAIYENSTRFTNPTNINERSTKFSTFGVQNHNKDDDKSDTHCTRAQKLLFYEVSREELKVDIGPYYPSSSEITVKSLGRRVTQKEKIVLDPLPKHPAKSTIPKHPYISLSRDELFQPEASVEKNQYQHTRDNFSPFNPSNYVYDIPRKFVSGSETGIFETIRFTFDKSWENKNQYDVPRTRPKSSGYDDVLSLRRRNADLGDSSATQNNIHSSLGQNMHRYATFKPKNKFSKERRTRTLVI